MSTANLSADIAQQVSIDVAMVDQFNANIMILLQDKGSKLQMTVMEDTIHGEEKYYDRIGSVEAQRINTRYQKTPLAEVPHDRRAISMEDWALGTILDKLDMLRYIADFTNPYVSTMGFAMGRRFDDTILNALFGVAKTGRKGTGTAAFPASQVIPGNHKPTGATGSNVGLTIGKLREAKVMLDQAEIDPDMPRYIAAPARQLDHLLGTTEFTSADYNTVKALVQGDVNTFMGFNFIRTERVLTDSNNLRRLPCYTSDALLYGWGKRLTTEINTRPDLQNNPQILCSASFGAVRTEEERVIEIKCTEQA